MTILAGDIKIFQSDTMDDVPEGGGSLTGNVVISGQSNNMFDDISTLDRVFGAVHLRKAFAQVFTQNTDKYYGSHIIIAKLPDDEKIGMTLFSTNNWFDRRPSAQEKIENYLATGSIYIGTLWATQHQGSRVITIFQSVETPIVTIGDTLVLLEDISDISQFVKLVEVTESLVTFEDAKGFYVKRILQLEISEPLIQDFEGIEVQRLPAAAPTSIFNTIVVDAARYYSSRPSSAVAVLGDSSIQVDSVLSQLVPNTTSSSSVVDIPIGLPSVTVVESDASTGAEVELTLGLNFNDVTETYNLPTAIKKGSLKFGNGAYDDGLGKSTIGDIDYINGTFNAVDGTAVGQSVFYTPAARPTAITESLSLPITVNNRSFTYVAIVKPLPASGTTSVSYRTLGKWFDLIDDGTGALRGVTESLGVGSVNLSTGSVSLTLGFLPDVDSEILFSWSTGTSYINSSDSSEDKVYIKHTLVEEGVSPQSVAITWNDGVARTASSDSKGDLTGDGVGEFNLSTSEITLIPNTIPNQNQVFTVNYDFGASLTQVNNSFGAAGNVLTVDFGVTNLIAGSVRISFLAKYLVEGSLKQTSSFAIRDDGVGGLESLNGTAIVGSSINYVTGIASFDCTVSLPISNKSVYSTSFHEYQAYSKLSGGYDPTSNIPVAKKKIVINSVTNYDGTYTNELPTELNLIYRTASANAAPAENFTLSNLKLDVTKGFDVSIVPFSLVYNLGGKDYFDNNGTLITDYNIETKASISVGTVDFSTGVMTINAWVGGTSNTGKLKSLLTDMTKKPVGVAMFRVKKTPVQVESLTIRYVSVDYSGEQVATSDALGNITGNGLIGYINWQTGVAAVQFGDVVVAAGNEAEDWYVAADVDDTGNILNPSLGYIDTIFYNAVGIVNIPLDSAILGLNPVRLPPDGRVPIYAKGGVVVILNEKETVATYANNAVVDVGRLDLAKLTVRDSAGNVVSSSAYTADLNTGIVTLGDLTGISQPLTLVDRVEDMVVLTDVQVTGHLGLSQPLKHDYPVAGTLVCSALIAQDLFARTSIPFDQQTWSGEWSNTLIGSEVIAQFNQVAFPILVDNATCITERWALIFTSATDFNIVGENVGVIGTGDITSETAPVNILTGGVYWTINFLSFGIGWAAGNVVRFNTYGAGAPFWLIQSISQGDETSNDYTSCIEVRGDKSAL